MDKQLIERIALEAMCSMAADEDADLAEIVDDMEDEDKRVMVEFCARFLDRIDAERGKSAVAWMSPGKERLEFSRQDTVYGSHTLPLFPFPTIPEGMVLVPIDPAEEMLIEGRRADRDWCEVETDINIFESGLVAIYKAMIAAAQGERNAD